MKEIQTKNFKKIKADLMEHPPLFNEDDNLPKKDKKMKKIYQLGIEVEDVDLEGLELRG